MAAETTPSNRRRLVDCRGKSCDASFFWVECLRRDGRISRVPIDREPVEVADNTDPLHLKGRFIYLTVDRVRAAVPGDTGEFFESHFHTCPDADDFRGRPER